MSFKSWLQNLPSALAPRRGIDAELHGHRTHGEKIRQAPKPWQQIDPGAMKGGPHGYQVR